VVAFPLVPVRVSESFADSACRSIALVSDLISDSLATLCAVSRLPGSAEREDGCRDASLSTPFHKYGLVFREDHSLTVVAPNGGARQQAVWQYVSDFRNGT